MQRWSPDRAASMAYRVLLVGADLRWSRAVRNVAREMPNTAVDAVPSGRAALARLLDRQAPYTHVLMNPARHDGLLTTLLGMTCDEENSGTALLLLGRTPAAPSRASVIPGPSHQAIRAALATGCGVERTTPPSVATLRMALADQRIDIRYQPLVRLSDRGPAGLEALARLQRIGHGMIAPEHFVPWMENAGLAADLTGLVAARILVDLISPVLSAHDFSIGLNVPLEVLLVPDALRRLDAEREAAGVPASRLVIDSMKLIREEGFPRSRGAL
jgi:hypothetical protein